MPHDPVAAPEPRTSGNVVNNGNGNGNGNANGADQGDSPISSPTPRTPPSSTAQEEQQAIGGMVAAVTANPSSASEPCARSSVGPMEEDSQNATVAVV
jgi:hypothetical protein